MGIAPFYIGICCMKKGTYGCGISLQFHTCTFHMEVLGVNYNLWYNHEIITMESASNIPRDGIYIGGRTNASWNPVQITHCGIKLLSFMGMVSLLDSPCDSQLSQANLYWANQFIFKPVQVQGCSNTRRNCNCCGNLRFHPSPQVRKLE